MTAWQRQIREREGQADPRPVPPSLRGYTVAEVTRSDARAIILQYEWLGTMGRSVHFMGLLAPDGDLQGVACFGYGPPSPIRAKRIGEPALCLERGACVHYAPKNAASFLINRACKLVHKYSGTAIFFAYCDPDAGEYGGVYQACGWLYLGQGLQNDNQRPTRTMVLKPGDDPRIHTNWHSTRVLRDAGFREKGAYKAAEAVGWTILREGQPGAKAGKHVYCTNVGPDRAAWREGIRYQPYPAPDPLLKLSPENAL